MVETEELNKRCGEMLMEMERFYDQAQRRVSRSGSVGSGSGNGLRACQPPYGLGLATQFCFPRKILRVLFGYFEHQRRVQFEGCVAEPLQTMSAIFPGSKWSCLLLRVVLQDALSEVTKFYPPLKLKVFCG